MCRLTHNVMRNDAKQRWLYCAASTRTDEISVQVCVVCDSAREKRFSGVAAMDMGGKLITR